MIIQNQTHYVTSDLKSFILRAIKESVKEGEENRTRRLTVKVVHSQGNYYDRPVERYTGYAYYNGRFMRLRIPKELNNKEKFAWLVMHEYDHIVGYHHRQMDGHYNTAWVNDYEIRIQSPKVKEKIDVRLVRYERTKKLLKEKQTQMKRLQTSIKKYAKRVKYYEKMLIAKGSVEVNQEANTIVSQKEGV